MKKCIILALLITIMSCKKQVIEPTPPPPAKVSSVYNFYVTLNTANTSQYYKLPWMIKSGDILVAYVNDSIYNINCPLPFKGGINTPTGLINADISFYYDSYSVFIYTNTNLGGNKKFKIKVGLVHS